ncbi:MAG: hypothetical protein HXY34_11260 [Candidatus Thorarchaeota archaeon]|nr:hypothetical protein [Candidatus Thorarchaeota archaeon]
MQTVDMIVREVHMGLWFLVVGYYFFLFIFLLFFRWRNSRNPFQLAMALFFLLLAVGRVFYFIGDFFADPKSMPTNPPGLTPFLNPSSLEGVLGQWLGIGGFFEWMALAVLSATAGFMIFGKRWAEIGFMIPAAGFAVALAVLPYSLVSYYAGLAGVLYALFLPALFWYLSWQSGGLLRISNFLLGLGFLVLFTGRVLHAGRFILDTLGIITYSVSGVLAPGLIVIGLILIATGNEWGQSQ